MAADENCASTAEPSSLVELLLAPAGRCGGRAMDREEGPFRSREG
jgi:hypothetical protein